MVGIIVSLDMDKHWLFKNYYYAIKNVFPNQNIKQVNSIDDLQNIKLLFICDEHYYYNKVIWMNAQFIHYCNQNGIKVVIFNNEKIYNSQYPWNEEIQRNVLQFNNRLQFVYDVDDSEILGSPINKTYMSKTFYQSYNFSTINKKDKCIFIGNINSHSYENRLAFLNEIKGKIDIDIIESDEIRTMDEYLNLISLNPPKKNLLDYTSAKYREGRDIEGKLTYHSPYDVMNIIKNCEVFDLKDNQIKKVSDLIQ